MKRDYTEMTAIEMYGLLQKGRLNDEEVAIILGEMEARLGRRSSTRMDEQDEKAEAMEGRR